jgi:Aspartyl protease
MKIILKLQTLGAILSFLLLYSCAVADSIEPQLPADVTINEDAGRGNLLFVTLRLESGEELPFFVDTGSTFTSFDKSLESKLGKHLGGAELSSWGVTKKAVSYAAPKLYLGNVPLMIGNRVYIGDFKQLSSQTGRPVMGILGMDCLRHYCIQLDFEAGKIHFLDSDHLDASQLGKAFPLTFRQGCPFIHVNSLVGEEGTNLLVDAGYRSDGALESGLFQREVQKLQSEGKAINGQHAGRIWFSKCDWNGENYTNLLIGDGGTNFSKGQGGNEMGLRFLARHLVTFDFPKEKMYLKQTSVGPLVDGKIISAEEFLNNLKEKKQLPGWSTNDDGTIYLEPYPDFEAFDGRKNGDSSIYHYKIAQVSEGDSWKLQKAWRTDQDGKTIEELPAP